VQDVFADRRDAGHQLGAAVADLIGSEPAVVLALPRGGVSVGVQVAEVLGCPLDVLVVRKVGVPGHRELAMGALAGGTVVRNRDVIASVGVDEATFERVAAQELAVAQAREQSYRGIRTPVPVAGRTAIVVDDGLATGATARAALTALRARDEDRPARVVLAIPVAPPDTLDLLAALCDDVVCLRSPRDFYAVGAWYADFTQVDDAEVERLLARA
jgi:predicted phosphoribosyltransferase